LKLFEVMASFSRGWLAVVLGILCGMGLTVYIQSWVKDRLRTQDPVRLDTVRSEMPPAIVKGDRASLLRGEKERILQRLMPM